MIARIPARDLDVNRRHRRRRTSRERLAGASDDELVGGSAGIVRQDSTTSSVGSTDSFESSLWTGSSAASPSDTVLSGMRTVNGARSHRVDMSDDNGGEISCR